LREGARAERRRSFKGGASEKRETLRPESKIAREAALLYAHPETRTLVTFEQYRYLRSAYFAPVARTNGVSVDADDPCSPSRVRDWTAGRGESGVRRCQVDGNGLDIPRGPVELCSHDPSRGPSDQSRGIGATTPARCARRLRRTAASSRSRVAGADRLAHEVCDQDDLGHPVRPELDEARAALGRG